MASIKSHFSQTSFNDLTVYKRVVIKIGSALLVDYEQGTLHLQWLRSLIEDIHSLRLQGVDVICVSSGSIALGRGLLGLSSRTLKLEESQAAASVGQIALARAYADLCLDYDIVAAQILLTMEDGEARRRYLNARSTLYSLLKMKALPVVNENDTIATTEIRYGDNDRLAARVATMVEADCLILLSDVDGLYTASPSQNKDALHIPFVDDITPDIQAMAGDAQTGFSKGGMRTKLDAAQIAMMGGAHMVITFGNVLHPLKALMQGARATWFKASSTPHRARKQWIAAAMDCNGVLIIDKGAEEALFNGRSLLAAGVNRIDGQFERGDSVLIKTMKGQEIARGLIGYDKHEMVRIKGCQSEEIASLIGYHTKRPVIHRDDMAFL